MTPGIDGFETCKRLKAIGRLWNSSIIFIMAKTDMQDLARGFEFCGVGYITKPVKPLEVCARVGAHLKIKRLVEEQEEHLAELEQARKELQEVNATKDKFLSNIGRNVQDSFLKKIANASALLRNSLVDSGLCRF